ncbi:hypothetical protein PO909_018603, partial [Leuciscus waleckii]
TFPRTCVCVSAHLNQEREKRVVFLTARVHPGESPASFICQGFIDFLVSQHPTAQVLRDHVIFKIVPMLNPDGVYLGNYRAAEVDQWFNGGDRADIRHTPPLTLEAAALTTGSAQSHSHRVSAGQQQGLRHLFVPHISPLPQGKENNKQRPVFSNGL